jgi:hypothetical protein
MARLLPSAFCALILPLALGCEPDKDDSGPVVDDTGDSSPVVDRDGDGSPAGEDCDDLDPARYPGAPDICNDIDDDCDEEIDEDPDIAWYLDADGDGFGDASDSVGPSCEPHSGYVANAADCDDADASIFPGALEVCDGVDNNCSGEVDEGAATYVAEGGSATGMGTQMDPLDSIQAALDRGAVCVAVEPGTYAENLTVTVGPLWLYGTNGAASTAVDGGGAGSALTVRSSNNEPIVIEGLSLVGGSETNGGGLRVIGGEASLVDVVITGNTASNYGGGAYLYDASVTFEGVEVAGNSADLGGGVYLDGGELYLIASALLSNDADDGGGLYNESGVLASEGCAFEQNGARATGGGLYMLYGEWLSIGDSISYNVAEDGSGGGAMLYAGAYDLDGTQIDGNSTNQGYGAGLYSYGANLTLQGGTITDNTASSGHGGGIYDYAGTIDAADTTIEGNYAWAGAGLALNSGYLFGTDLSISANTVGNGGGAGFALTNGAGLEINGGEVSGNNGYSFGAGMVDESYAYLLRVQVLDNYASYVGGLGAYSYGYLYLQNVVLDGNGDSSSSGGSSYYGAAITAFSSGGIYADFVTLVNTHGNYALRVLSGSYLYLYDSIVAFNEGYGLELGQVSSSYLGGGYNDFYGNAYGNNYYDSNAQFALEGSKSIAEDPLFVSYTADPYGDDLHLGSGSPCLDAGDSSQLDADGSRADMGAYGGPQGDW